jgi:hypothetical protein
MQFKGKGRATWVAGAEGGDRGGVEAGGAQTRCG